LKFGNRRRLFDIAIEKHTCCCHFFRGTTAEQFKFGAFSEYGSTLTDAVLDRWVMTIYLSGIEFMPR